MVTAHLAPPTHCSRPARCGRSPCCAVGHSFPDGADLAGRHLRLLRLRTGCPLCIGYFSHKRGGILRSGIALAGIVGGLIGCAAAHTLGTTFPYVIYGILASVVCLLIAHAVFDRRGPTGPAPTRPVAPELDAILRTER